MADKVGSGRHNFIKRTLLVTLIVAFSFAITYVSVSAVVLAQYDNEVSYYVGKIYSTFERDIACYFQSDKIASYIVNGKTQVCDFEKKDNVIFLTKSDDVAFEKELILINDGTIYSVKEDVYLHVMGGIQ